MHPIPLPSPDQRTADILSRVRIAFAENGFDGTSMQDLARAAGMSAGNFYRYFPSKAAIVEALIAHDLAGMDADFLTVLQSPSPLEALRALMQRRLIPGTLKLVNWERQPLGRMLISSDGTEAPVWRDAA